jgi:hypothetical protein
LRSSGARRLIKPQGYKHRAPPEQFAAKTSPNRLLVQSPGKYSIVEKVLLMMPLSETWVPYVTCYHAGKTN